MKVLIVTDDVQLFVATQRALNTRARDVNRIVSVEKVLSAKFKQKSRLHSFDVIVFHPATPTKAEAVASTSIATTLQRIVWLKTIIFYPGRAIALTNVEQWATLMETAGCTGGRGTPEDLTALASLVVKRSGRK